MNSVNSSQAVLNVDKDDGGEGSLPSLQGECEGESTLVLQGVVTDEDPDRRLKFLSLVELSCVEIDRETRCKVHAGLYNLLRLDRVNWVKMMFKIWQLKYLDSPRVVSEFFTGILPEVYDELKLKSVSLSEEVEFRIEDQLIGSCFNYEDDRRRNKEVPDASLEDVQVRIEMTIEMAKRLTSYDVDERKQMGQEFYLLARFLCQNLHVLKRQLRATYDRLPWEEMVFCLASFVSANTKCLEYNLAYMMVLNEGRVLAHLGHFVRELSKVKPTETKKIGQFPLKFSRDGVRKSVMERCKEFGGLYEDYDRIKDVYSLKRVESYVKVALSVDLRETEELGRLVIERSLQVIGECLKNSLESPNVTDDVHRMLLIAAPRNLKEVLTSLRDRLSHAPALSKKIGLESIDVKFFSEIQNDLKKLDAELRTILYNKQMGIVKWFLKKVIVCESRTELDDLTSCLVVAEMDDIDIRHENTREFEDIKGWVDELISRLATERERGFFREVERVVSFQETRVKQLQDSFVDSLFSMEYLARPLLEGDDVEIVHDRARRDLRKIDNATRPDSLDKIVGILNDFTASSDLSGQYDLQENKKIERLVYQIRATVLFRAGRIKGIEMFEEGLDNKESDPLRKAKEEIGRVFTEIVAVLVLIDDRKAVESQFGILKETYEKMLKLGKPKRSGYQTLLDSVKNAIVEEKPFKTYVKRFKEFFSSFKGNDLQSKLKAAFENVSQNEENRHRRYLENRLEILGRLLPACGDDGFETVEVYVEDRALQAAVEIVVLDVMEAMSERSLLVNDPFYFDGCSPVLTGITLRNYLAHGDALVDVLPFNSSVAIISNALRFVKDGRRLVEAAADVTVIGRLTAHDLGALKTRHARDFNIGRAQSEMFAASSLGDVEKIRECLLTGADINARDHRGWTGLCFAVHGNSLEGVKFFLERNVYVGGEDVYGKSLLHIAASSGSDKVIGVLTEGDKLNVNVVDHRCWTPLHYGSVNGCQEVVVALLERGAKVNVVNEGKATPLHLAANGGHVGVVRVLLDWAANVGALTKSNMLPIHAAAIHGNVAVVEVLLSERSPVDTPSKKGFTPLHFAVYNGHMAVVEVLLANKARVNALDKDHATSLHMAACGGDVELVELLIANGAEVNVVTKPGGFSPLHHAAILGHVSVVKALLKKGASVDAWTEGGCTALHLAASDGRGECVEVLVAARADLNAKGPSDFTPLHFAANSGVPNIVGILLLCGASVDARCEYKRTPLHYACLLGCGEAVGKLIDAGANPLARDENGVTPLYCLVGFGHGEVLKSVLKTDNVRMDKDVGESLLYVAAGRGHKDIVESLLSRGVNVNALSEGNMTPLHFAAGQGHFEVVSLLLERDATVDPETDKHATPLHLACIGHERVVDILLKHHANVHARTVHRWTPLHFASHNGLREVVSKLLDANADVNALDDDPTTPLHLAAQSNYKDVVEVLILRSANVDAISSNGHTPLHLAVSHNHTEIVRILLHYHADVDARDDSDLTPLHFAAYYGYLEISNALLASNANPNARKEEKETPLHLAACEGHLAVVVALLKSKADPDATNTLGWTPLHYSASKGYETVSRSLLQHGASIDPPDDAEMTPLHLAAMNGHVGVVTCLLGGSARVDAQSKSGATPLLFAVRKGRVGVVKVLLDGGARLDKGSLQVAMSKCHLETVRELVVRGAYVLGRDEGSTVLHLAVESGDVEVVRAVLDGVVDRVRLDEREMKGLKEQESAGISGLKEQELIGQSAGISGHKEQEMIGQLADISGLNEQEIRGLTNQELSGQSAGISGHKEQEMIGQLADISCLNEQEISRHKEQEMSGQSPDISGLKEEEMSGQSADISGHKEQEMIGQPAGISGLKEQEMIVQSAGISGLKEQEMIVQSAGISGIKEQEMIGKSAGINGLKEQEISGQSAGISGLKEQETIGQSVDTSGHKEQEMSGQSAGISGLKEQEMSGQSSEIRRHLDAKDQDGDTPLLCAAYEGKADIARLLLDRGADPNVTNCNNWSSLHVGTVRRDTELVRVLVDGGADIGIVGEGDMTPVDVARYKGYADIERILMLNWRSLGVWALIRSYLWYAWAKVTGRLVP